MSGTWQTGFLCLLLAATVCDSLSVTSLSIVRKTIRLTNNAEEGYVLEAEFDEDIYGQRSQCTPNGLGGLANYDRCCTSANDTNCLRSDSHTCIDGNTAISGTLEKKSGGFSEDNGLLLTARIFNIATCDSLLFMTESLVGDPSVYISLTNPIPTQETADVVIAATGSDYWFTCCSALRDLANSSGYTDWKGELYINIVPNSPTVAFTSYFENSLLLNLTKYWHEGGTTVQCGTTVNITIQQCLTACIPLPPTPDPAFNFFAAQSIISSPNVYRPRTLARFLLTQSQSIQDDGTVTVTNPFPKNILDDPTCKVVFRGIVNIQRQGISSSVALAKPKLPCESETFIGAATTLGTFIRSFNQLTGRLSLDQVRQITTAAAALLVSDSFAGCQNLAEVDLASIQSSASSSLTSACLAAPNTLKYITDPCCNALLGQCCALRTVQTTTNLLIPNDGAINSTCEFSLCGSNAVKDYTVLANSAADITSGCAAETAEALNSPSFIAEPVLECYYRIYGVACQLPLKKEAQCSEFFHQTFQNSKNQLDFASSVCLPNGQCSIPCTTNSDCPLGVCNTTGPVSTCSTIDEATNRNNPAFLTCVRSKMSPISFIHVRNALNISSTDSSTSILAKVWAEITSPQCEGSYYPDLFENQTQCEAARMCNHKSCDSLSDPACTQASCVPTSGSPDFCGLCHGDFCDKLTQQNECSMSNLFYNCTEYGGSIDAVSGKCIIASTTSAATCLPADRCQSYTAPCVAYCYDPSLTSSATCQGVDGAGFARAWVTFAHPTTGLNYSYCALPDFNSNFTLGQDKIQCQANSYTWWPGYSWTDAAFTSQISCTGTCIGGDSLANSAATCVASGQCSHFPNVTSEAQCQLEGACSDPAADGCLVPLHAGQTACTNPAAILYASVGFCIDTTLNSTFCGQIGGQWHTKATTNASCLAPVFCRQPGAGFLKLSSSAAECQSTCGGTPTPAFEWITGSWTPAKWQPYTWAPYRFFQANSWSSGRFNVAKASALQDIGYLAIVGQAVASDLYCRFDRSLSALRSVACACGTDNGGCSRAFDQITSSVLAVKKLCTGLGGQQSFGDLSLVTQPNTVVTTPRNTGDCSDVSVESVANSQFQDRKVITFSSGFIAKDEGRQSQVRYIKNPNKIVVGEIIDDGVTFGFEGELTNTKTCLSIPKSSGSDYAFFAVATANEDFTTLSPLPETITDVTGRYDNESISICAPVTTARSYFFPIGLAEDWATATFFDRLEPGEKAIIYISAVFYFSYLVVTVFHFVSHLKYDKDSFWALPKLALFFLTVFLTIRLIYILIWPDGVTSRIPALGVLIGELPTIVFLSVFTVLIVRWMEIYHHTIKSAGAEISKMRPLLIAANAVVYAAFIVLVILFFTLTDSNPPANCTNDPSVLTRTTAEIVAIVYKFFFAAVCLAISIGFAVYGSRIINLMQNSNKLTRSGLNNRKVIRLIIVTSICTFCLMAQVGNLIHSSFSPDRNIYGVNVALWIIELVPSGLFIFMFKVSSDFTQKLKGFASRVDSLRSAASRVMSRSNSVGAHTSSVEKRNTDPL